MRKRNQNPAVQALSFIREHGDWRLRRQGEEPTLEEWQLAFEAFKSFHYVSAKARLQDLSAMHLKGVTLFEKHQMFQESLALLEWMLQDEQFIQAKFEVAVSYTLVLFSKVNVLQHLGRGEEAAEFYLKEARLLAERESCRSWVFMFGKDVFNTSHWDEPDLERRAPRFVIDFYRELLQITYPDRELPAPFREYEEEQAFTCRQVQAAINEI